MNAAQTGVVAAIVDGLSDCPAVVAVALSGSVAAQMSDDLSDVDIYVFTSSDVPVEIRRELALRFDPAPEIDNRYFGPTDEWIDAASGVAVDLTYWDQRWFEDELTRVIDEKRPALGYTTAFWHTMRHATPLFDRTGWLAAMQRTAASPYPPSLRMAIVTYNQPLLCTVRSSYRHQIELAVARDDPVSVNHRLAAYLASLFDIVFAANSVLHPGEKRLLAHAAALPSLPEHFIELVRALLVAPPGEVLPALDALCEFLDVWLAERGLILASTADRT